MIRKIANCLLLVLFSSILMAACSASATQEAANSTAAHTNESVAAASRITVYKSPTCSCCESWIEHMEAHGYTVESINANDLAAIKAEHAVPAQLQSCHTAIVDGYVIEGHVPAAEVTRLLEERPNVAGLAVPGMPIGSPGMEIEGQPAQPFDVIAFDGAERTTVFANYAGE